MSEDARRHIERLMYQAVYQENQEIAKNRDYWKNLYFDEKEKGMK